MSQFTERRVRNQTAPGTAETIDLLELAGVLWSKVHIIILCGIITGLLAFIGTRLFITPQYVSTTKVYIMSKNNESNTISSSDLQAGSYLASDYGEIVKSRTVMEQAIALLDLQNIGPGQLMNMVSVSVSTNSRILTIGVTDSNPKQAQEIADAVRECASVQIENILGENSVDMIDSASLPTNPSSPNVMKNTELGALAGMMLAAALFTLIFVLDTTIRTTEDIENYLGLNTLAKIPDMDENRKMKRRKRRAGR